MINKEIIIKNNIMEQDNNVMKQYNNAAKFAFFYMLSLVSLVFTALSVGMIIFQIINKSIPDILNEYSGRYSPEQLKFAISALIISAPIYFITMKQIFKNLFSGELSKDSQIRKWLTYFVLLVSSVVMIGWLIGTINNFLDGELTMKFILKALTAIAISAAVFSFYLHDIKREAIKEQKDKIISIYAYASIAVVIVSFVASLFFVESPQATRNRKLDNAILERFNKIDGAMETYYNDYEQMPGTLEMLVGEYTYITSNDLKNISTNKMFEYKIVGDNEYELCTDFLTTNANDEDNRYGYYKDRWPHEEGWQCLSQKVREHSVKLKE